MSERGEERGDERKREREISFVSRSRRTSSAATHLAIEAHDTLEPGAIVLLAGLAGAGAVVAHPSLAATLETGVSGLSSACCSLLEGTSSPHPTVAVVEAVSVALPQSEVADDVASSALLAAAGVEEEEGPHFGTERVLAGAAAAGAGAEVKEEGVEEAPLA